MKDGLLLESEGFKLSLNLQVFESDISYPSNTILSVCVFSEGFSASATMDVDINDVLHFCNELQKVYDSLKGEAKIQEPFGNRQYIMFSCDKKGHFFISGTLNSDGANGLWQELKFENVIDQTVLLQFIKSLVAFSQQFIK